MKSIIKISLLVVVAIAFASSTLAKGHDKVVYAFGFGTCLGDTVVYVSSVQQLENAQINHKTGFLENRSDYSYEMERKLQTLYNKAFTCTIIFATEKSKAEKQYLKLKKHLLKDKSLRVEYLTSTDFQFSPIANTND